MNTYGGLEAELHLRTFLTPALDEIGHPHAPVALLRGHVLVPEQ